MKKIFLPLIFLACLATGLHASQSGDATAAIPATVSATNSSSDTTLAPLVVFVPVAPAPVYSRTPYLLWPAVSFGFGFGHPYVSGYSRGYYGHVDYGDRR